VKPQKIHVNLGADLRMCLRCRQYYRGNVKHSCGATPCRKCKGTGTFSTDEILGRSGIPARVTVTCDSCNGTGKVS
jgi:DnaJ-class molecular chaperone